MKAKTLTTLTLALFLALCVPAFAVTFITYIAGGTVHSVEVIVVTTTTASGTVTNVYTYLTARKPGGNLYRGECRDSLSQPCRELSPGDGVTGSLLKDDGGKYWNPEDITFTHATP